MVSVTAPAKINLSLHVQGKREDGYHLLETYVVFTEAADRVSVTAHPGADFDFRFQITGPFSAGLSDGPDNLVMKAAGKMSDVQKGQGHESVPTSITLEKNLPVASGIGGGSADAAATLIALDRLWNLNERIDLLPIALELGADVPMCLHSSPLFASGIGDEISFPVFDRQFYMVLVNPGVGVSTADVFRQLDATQTGAVSTAKPASFPDLDTLHLLRNDLQAASIRLAPEIREALDVLETTRPLVARMSGSGATCFGIYPTSELASQAAERITQSHPHWWCIATATNAR